MNVIYSHIYYIEKFKGIKSNWTYENNISKKINHFKNHINNKAKYESNEANKSFNICQLKQDKSYFEEIYGVYILI